MNRYVVYVLLVASVIVTACAPESVFPVVATEPAVQYSVIVTVNDVRIFSQDVEGEVEFVFYLNLSYVDFVAICRGGDENCIDQVDKAWQGNWPSTLETIGPFLYRDGGEENVEVTIKSWPGDGECDSQHDDTGVIAYQCSPGGIVRHVIEYDASRHTEIEADKTVVHVDLPYMRVKLTP